MGRQSQLQVLRMLALCRISLLLVHHFWSKGIAHNQDEYMDEKDLLLNLEIYMQAMIALTEA